MVEKKLPSSFEEKRRWIKAEQPGLSIRRQCELLGLNRSSWYYEPAGESPENLRLMKRIDEHYLKTPYFGSRKMAERFGVNRKRVQRLMRLMGLEAVYPKPRTTQSSEEHRIYPYLLRLASRPGNPNPGRGDPGRTTSHPAVSPIRKS